MNAWRPSFTFSQRQAPQPVVQHDPRLCLAAYRIDDAARHHGAGHLARTDPAFGR